METAATVLVYYRNRCFAKNPKHV